jgi:hypothetical protein
MVLFAAGGSVLGVPSTKRQSEVVSTEEFATGFHITGHGFTFQIDSA